MLHVYYYWFVFFSFTPFEGVKKHFLSKMIRPDSIFRQKQRTLLALAALSSLYALKKFLHLNVLW